MRRSSPRASMGFSMLDADQTFAATGAHEDVQLVDERDDGAVDLLRMISLRTLFSRSSNWPRYIAPATSAGDVSRDELYL